MSHPSVWTAALWGLLSGSGVVLGALVGHFARPGRHLVGAVMGFGAGVLLSVVAFDLMEEAHDQMSDGHLAVIAFLVGVVLFVVGDFIIDYLGGEHRKRSHAMPDEINGGALWLGAAL